MAENKSARPLREASEEELERHEETIRTVRRVLHALLATLLFCTITVATAPDAHLVRADVQVTMPVIGFNIPFDSFLVIGPTVIVALWAYMHIFYGEFLRFCERYPEQKEKLPTLFNIDSVFARAVSYFFFYWLPIVVLAFFAWKATPRPILGTALMAGTSVLVVGSVAVQLVRCAGAWCRWVQVPAVVAGIGVVVALVIASDSYRTFDLVETDLTQKDLRDAIISGANVRGASFTGADLRRASLSGAEAAGANFAGANLSGADLSRANLRGARFHDADLTDVSMAGANLQEADFRHVSQDPGDQEGAFPAREIKKANNWILAHYTWEQLLALGIATPEEASRVDPSAERNRRIEDRDLRGTVLAGHNLVGADLTGFRLSGADLTGADLTGARLDDAGLQNANLTDARGVSLQQVAAARNWVLATYDQPAIVKRLKQRGIADEALSGADLSKLDLKGANLAAFDLKGASFRESDLTDATFRDEERRTNVQFADFREATITRRALDQTRNWQLAYFSPDKYSELGLASKHNTHLDERDFSGVRFTQPLEPLNLDGADLRGFSFVGANLTGSSFGASKLTKSDFSEANLTKATFDEAELDGARLAEAILHDARLSDSNLQEADLRRAQFTRAILEGVNLERASLDGAGFTGAKLNGVRLAGASLKNAHLQLTTVDCEALAAAEAWKEARFRSARVVLSGNGGPDDDDGARCPDKLRELAVGRVERSGPLEREWRRVRALVADQLGIEETEVSPQAHLHSDLNMDDPDIVNLVVTLEEAFDCPIPDEIGDLIRTPDDAARVVVDCSEAPVAAPVSKPVVRVGTIGDPRHGKALMTSALTKVLSDLGVGDTEYVPLELIENPPEKRARGISVRIAHVEYETEARRYSHAEMGEQSDYLKSMITGAVQLDGTILVVDIPDGPTQATEQQLRLANFVGVPSLVVYLNAAGKAGLPALKAAEARMRSFVASYGYDPSATPIVWGSADAALEGGDGQLGEESILRLLDALNKTVSPPKPRSGRPFLMPIEDVFSVSGRGTVVTGRIEGGIVEDGDRVEIVGLQPTRQAEIGGVEMFRKDIERGEAGDNVGVLLRAVERQDLERGQVLAAPDTIRPHVRFQAVIYLLSQEDGGRQTPIFSDYRPRFYFRTTDVAGRVRLLRSDRDMVKPGESAVIEAELAAAIAMEPGLRFAVREKGRTVAAGVVTAVIPEQDNSDGT